MGSSETVSARVDRAGGSTGGFSDPVVVHETSARLGANVLRLGRELTEPKFLMRRSERVEFVDATTAERSVEVHLRLSPFSNTADYPLRDGLLLLPVARLVRRDNNGVHVHTTFSVKDDRGRELPRLTRVEERGLVFDGVWLNAVEILGRDPKAKTVGALGSVIFREGTPDEAVHDSDPEDHALFTPAFRALLLEASERFYLIAQLKPSGYRSQVVTYSYEEQPDFDSLTLALGSGFHWWSPLAWWRSRLLSPQPGAVAQFATPAAGDCSSFHFELAAPPDVIVPPKCARLHWRRAFGDFETPIVEDDGSDHRAHVFFEPPDQPVADAFVRVRMLLGATGTYVSLRAASLFNSLICLLAAAACWLNPEAVGSWDRSATVAVLLAGPGVVTAALSLRSKHPLPGRMSWGPRLNAVVPGVMIYIGAASIVARPLNAAAARFAWSAAAVVGMACAVRVLNEWRWRRRVGSEAV